MRELIADRTQGVGDHAVVIGAAGVQREIARCAVPNQIGEQDDGDGLRAFTQGICIGAGAVCHRQVGQTADTDISAVRNSGQIGEQIHDLTSGFWMDSF